MSYLEKALKIAEGDTKPVSRVVDQVDTIEQYYHNTKHNYYVFRVVYKSGPWNSYYLTLFENKQDFQWGYRHDDLQTVKRRANKFIRVKTLPAMEMDDIKKKFLDRDAEQWWHGTWMDQMTIIVPGTYEEFVDEDTGATVKAACFMKVSWLSQRGEPWVEKHNWRVSMELDNTVFRGSSTMSVEKALSGIRSRMKNEMMAKMGI